MTSESQSSLLFAPLVILYSFLLSSFIQLHKQTHNSCFLHTKFLHKFHVF